MGHLTLGSNQLAIIGLNLNGATIISIQFSTLRTQLLTPKRIMSLRLISMALWCGAWDLNIS